MTLFSEADTNDKIKILFAMAIGQEHCISVDDNCIKTIIKAKSSSFNSATFRVGNNHLKNKIERRTTNYGVGSDGW